MTGTTPLKILVTGLRNIKMTFQKTDFTLFADSYTHTFQETMPVSYIFILCGWCD